MSDYKAYLINSDGHIFQAMNLDMADDAAALEAALHLVDGHDVELWQGARKSQTSSVRKNHSERNSAPERTSIDHFGSMGSRPD